MTKTGFKKYAIFSLIVLVLIPVVSLKIEFSNQTEGNQYNFNNLRIASNISEIDLSQLPEIDNSKWYDSKIEMLIITPNQTDFIEAVTPLMEWKNEKGLKTIILSNFSKYPGRDDAEKIRNMIKSFYEKENIKWVLLCGDAEESSIGIPIRYVYNPDVIDVGLGDHETVGGDIYKPTDYYYADLTGSWDEDNDNLWGESAKYNSNGIDEISWTHEVYVGRFPANSAEELEVMVNKSLKYEKDPFIGDWMNNMLLAGGISSFEPDEDEARLTEYIWNNYIVSEMNFTHLHKTTGSFTPSTPPPPNQEEILDFNNFDTHINTGYSTIIFAGHGSPTSFVSIGINPPVYDSNDASTSANNHMPSLLYADACTTSSYDIGDNSIGELLIKRQNAGSIGYIGALRVSWYIENDTNLEYVNRGNAKLFWKEFFEEKLFQQGKALYNSKTTYMNSEIFKSHNTSMYSEWQRKNVLTYCLLGDPELNIYTKIPKNVLNPFTEDIYEGQLVSITIKDVLNKTIPFASIHLNSSDGKYRTVYADINGTVKFRLPAQENELYEVYITGHNIIPTRFNFTTLPDGFYPEILNITWSPLTPSVSDNICFNITTFDNHSRIESVFILLSENNFKEYNFYRVLNEFEKDKITFVPNLNKLDPGIYSFLIVVRNYANNSIIAYETNFNFTVPKPFTDFVLVIASIMIVGLAGISSTTILVGIRKYKKDLRKLE